MSLQQLATSYADYNAWATQQFADWLSTKPDDLLHKEISSSYPSIIKTLNHIWAAEEYWYAVIAETRDFENRRQIEHFETKEILTGGVKRANLLADLIRSYSEEDLMKTVHIENRLFQCDLPKYEYLLQVVNHGTYHRGQIVTMGRNVGITDASITDYIFYNAMK
jgi:uncharacterized damage-inducible protein DinB